MTKQEAWAALDAARIPAWRQWSEDFRRFKKEGLTFQHALWRSTWLMQYTLFPYYKAVEEAT